MNIIPVDYVAQAAVRIIENPANHRRIFHLTHPEPPTYQQILDFVKDRFRLEGVQLLGSAAQLEMKPRNELEQLAYRQMEPVMAYFGNNPVFLRDNADRVLPDLKPPLITGLLMNRWLDHAIDNDWGQ